MFNLALRKAPAPLCDARIIAYLGGDAGTAIPPRWRPFLKDVSIRFVPMPTTVDGFVAQASKRFTEDDPDLDYIVLCDADTMILGDLDKVFLRLMQGAPVAGVIAHAPPPYVTVQDWQDLSTDLVGTPITLPHHYTLMSAPDAPMAPFYVNHGFLAFRADALREFSSPFLKMRPRVAERLRMPVFAGQVSLSLTLHALGWQGAALPIRYNFPNDDRAVALHADEARDIRLLHYLRERNFTRSSLFADPAAFGSFLQTQPQDPDELLFDALMRLTQGVYPFS